MKLFRTLFLGFCCVLLSIGAQAENIKIITIELAPAGYKDKGESKGMAYDIANEIAKRAGFNYSNKLKPFPRVVSELISHKADMSILLKNSSVANSVVLVTPVFDTNTIVIGQKGLDINSLDDLKGKKVAIIRSGTFHKQLEEHSGMSFYPVVDYKTGVKMLKAGRVDALTGVDNALYFTMKTQGLSRSEFGKPYTYNTQQAYLQLSNKKASDEMVTKLTGIVDGLREDKTIENIVAKYTAD